jgi:hypothetical protein
VSYRYLVAWDHTGSLGRISTHVDVVEIPNAIRDRSDFTAVEDIIVKQNDWLNDQLVNRPRILSFSRFEV